jgi:hypothetical protein
MEGWGEATTACPTRQAADTSTQPLHNLDTRNCSVFKKQERMKSGKLSLIFRRERFSASNVALILGTASFGRLEWFLELTLGLVAEGLSW